MICKTLNKFVAKTFANKTQANILQPKSINLYFPNSVRPEFKVLNIAGLYAVSFNIRENLERLEFTLEVRIYSNNSHPMEIAIFKSKEDAETALEEIRVALYNPTKVLVKWVGLLVLVGALGCIVTAHLNGFKGGMFHSSTNKDVATQSAVSSNGAEKNVPSGANIMMPPMPVGIAPKDIPPPIGNGELDSIINQIQQIKQLQDTVQQQQAQQQQVAQPEQVEPQQVDPTEQFLSGLK